MSNFLRIRHTKNYQNQLIFDRVIKKIKRWTFFGDPGYSVVTFSHYQVLHFSSVVINFIAKKLH